MLELTKENFEEEVIDAKEITLVDYWSPSCGKCMALMPFVHELEKKSGDKIKFTSLDTSKARRVAIGQKIMGLPVIAIYKDGVQIDSVIGDEADSKSVEELINKYL